jgi:Phage integrase, N-terminal SAM-like domain
MRDTGYLQRWTYDRTFGEHARHRLPPHPQTRGRSARQHSAPASMTARLPIILDANTRTVSPHPPDIVPALIAAAGERAARRFLEFFAANIRNPHKRRAYARAVAGFMTWCDANRVGSITAVQPLHVAAWIEQQTREHAAPTVKLRLAALRHLFDWLVTGQVVPTNPAGSVRGPAHMVRWARRRCWRRRKPAR